MDTLNIVTLPITEGRELTGLVSIDDIAKSYFESFDNRVLSNAKTSFANIVETLEGRVRYLTKVRCLLQQLILI